MGLRFATMAWHFDVLSLVGLGTACAICFSFIPAFVWSQTVIDRTPNMFWDKVAEWSWFGLTVTAIVGSYIFAFAILAGWID